MTELEQAIDRAGLETLRTGQRRCIEAAMSGRDALAIIPTGGGKSAIYQIAGSVIDGPTVVVSPLLALQDDQRHSIETSDLPAAAAIDGSTSDDQRAEIVEQLAHGTIEFLFVTPETLTTDAMLDALESVGVSLLVVDEAHCLVTWGHSFRPAYLEVGRARRRLGSPVCLALTASADPRLRDDIRRHLALDEPLIVVDDLSRDNIDLSVHLLADAAAARQSLIDDLADESDKTIVYAPTRALCESMAEDLSRRGRSARPFHGRLDAQTKTTNLDWFRQSTDGVVVATTAFGMGIDIHDIASVRHLDLPPTLIDYYQEIGRAGRDGKPASAIAYLGARKSSRRSFSGGVKQVDVQDCVAVMTALANDARSKKSIAAETGLSLGRVTRALTVLDMAGAAQLRPRLTILDPSIDEQTIEDICRSRSEFDRSQRQSLQRYASSTTCRWAQILAALGETCAPCGSCDCCRRAGADQDHPMIGRRVRHESFGLGTVSSTDDGDVTIAFDEVGPKQLDLELCVDRAILTLVEESIDDEV